MTHSFLHFTVQEFLAAYHLSLQSLETQALFYETHSDDPHFVILLGFLIGLNSRLLKKVKCPDSNIDFSHLHWLHESQSPKDVAHFLGNGVFTFRKYFNVSPFDIYTLTYCLCHSNCEWELGLDLEKLTSVFPAQKSDFASYSGFIDGLVIGNVTDSTLERFFSLPQILFLKLRRLSFYSTDATTLAVANIVKRGIFQNLHKFGWANDECSFSGVGDLVNAVQISCPRLTTFFSRKCAFASSDMLQLCKYISSPTCLAELSLVESEFQEDTLQLLISAIPCAKSLIHLDLSFNQFHQSDVEMLSVALSVNSTLKILILRSCSIDGEGAEHLATGLEDNHVLEELFLKCNDIDTKGAVALSEMLAINNSLKKLNLELNKSIGVEGAIKFLNALEHNNTLQTLTLPAECEPVEYQSFLMNEVRESGRVKFV